MPCSSRTTYSLKYTSALSTCSGEAYTSLLFWAMYFYGDSLVDHSEIVGYIARYNLQWNCRLKCDLLTATPAFLQHIYQFLTCRSTPLFLQDCIAPEYKRDSGPQWRRFQYCDATPQRILPRREEGFLWAAQCNLGTTSQMWHYDRDANVPRSALISACTKK